MMNSRFLEVENIHSLYAGCLMHGKVYISCRTLDRFVGFGREGNPTVDHDVRGGGVLVDFYPDS